MSQGRRKSLKFQSFGNEVQDKNISTLQQLKIIQDRHEIANVYNRVLHFLKVSTKELTSMTAEYFLIHNSCNW